MKSLTKGFTQKLVVINPQKNTIKKEGDMRFINPQKNNKKEDNMMRLTKMFLMLAVFSIVTIFALSAHAQLDWYY